MSTITIDQLKHDLSKKYSIKCFIDLADLTVSPSQAYKILQQHHQFEFLANDRLVFYTQHCISDRLLNHLYQAAELIDISNYFLLLCSPLDIVDQSGSDNFHSIKVDIENTKLLSNNFVLSDTLCPMPWTHVAINPLGNLTPCCVYQDTVGSVIKNSIEELFQSHPYTQLRQNLLLGEKVSGCSHCWNLEDHGLTSNRLRHLGLLKKNLLTKWLDTPEITSLDLSPGNTCNFKCRICNPTASSLFAQEVQIENGSIPIQSINWAESNSVVFDEISNFLPSLTNIDMYGGEPFLIKSLHRLIQQAVEQNQSQNIRLHYNSNGSIYPTHLVEHWKQFKHIDLHFSIDNVGKRFELERGGKWDQVQSNIQQLVDLKLPNLKISIMPTISIMNIFYLDELLAWADTLGLPVNFNYLDTPYEFNINNLTNDAKKLIVEKFQNYLWPEMINLVTRIKSSSGSNGKDFITLITHFDKIRGQNFSDTHAEIAHAMGM